MQIAQHKHNNIFSNLFPLVFPLAQTNWMTQTHRHTSPHPCVLLDTTGTAWIT